MGKMLILKRMHFGCYIIGGVGWEYLAFCLEESGTLVILFIDEVYCDATLGIAAFNYSLMYVVAIHALATMLWKQGWVDIYYSSRVCLNEFGGYKQQESCEYDKIDFSLL